MEIRKWVLVWNSKPGDSTGTAAPTVVVAEVPDYKSDSPANSPAASLLVRLSASGTEVNLARSLIRDGGIARAFDDDTAVVQ